MLLIFDFQNEKKLTEWLNRHRDEHSTPDSFYGWLENLLDEGNEIVVRGYNYTYTDCCELI